MAETKPRPPCYDPDCRVYFPVEIKGIFVSDAELREHGWVVINHRIYCPKCAIWNLAVRLNHIINENDGIL